MNIPEPTDLTAVRDVVLAAYPDCIPELVRGETIAELLASVEPARAAYVRIAESVTTAIEPPAIPPPPTVPAGGSHTVLDPTDLPAAEKVRRGIAHRTPSS